MYKPPEPDQVAEQFILAGILKHGEDAYLDVCDILAPEAMTDNLHEAVYRCIQKIYDNTDTKKVDIASILSVSKELGYKDFFERKTELQYLRGLTNRGETVELESVRRFAAKVQKIYILARLQKAAIRSVQDLGELSGTESLDAIFSKAEEAIFAEIQKLCGSESQGTTKLGDGIEAFVQNLIDNPNPNFGIPTPWAKYNKEIGGGLIRKELAVIAARAKQGKSFLGDNAGLFIADNFNIPVLNIDTELSREQHWIRLLGITTGIDMTDIKTGAFAKNPELIEKVKNATAKIQSLPYYYECVGGKQFEDVLSIMRRWVNKVVGKDKGGITKDCVILYDYIKLLDEQSINKNMAEHQSLGFLVTSLKNFLIRYDVPCLAFAQLNRAGIDQDSTDAVAGSDRILMYCSSLTFLKPKETEEMVEDGYKNGNRKMFTVAARNGPGTEDGDYVNMIFHKATGRIVEGKTKLELANEKKEKEGFETPDDLTL